MPLLPFFLLLFPGVLAGEILFGVVPQETPVQLQKRWEPVARYLSQTVGEEVRLRTERTIPLFEKALERGDYQLAFMNPFHYVAIARKRGYRPVARSSRDLSGILVVRKGAGVEKVEALRGKTFLFPAPRAFAAAMLVRYELEKKYGIDPYREGRALFVNSHGSVHKGVARGVGDAGGGIPRTLEMLRDEESRDALKVLYRTDSYPCHPFVVSGDLPEGLRERLTRALLNLPPALLEGLMMEPLVPTDDRTYRKVEEIAARWESER